MTPDVAAQPLDARLFGALRRRQLDVAATIAAVLLLLPTCFYRYGIDQALYHYVGAGWLHGRVPYRDAFDVKTPGIFAMYSLAITLFGAGQSSIRILELLSVLGTAALVATASGKDEPALAGRILPDGVFGFSALALAVFDVTLFGFWDTAQAEFWESAFVVASYASLVSGRLTRPASATSGVFAALATLMKPLALLALPILAFRAWRGAVAQKRTSTLLAFAVGFVAPLLLTAGYFSAVGAGPALREWLGYLPHYAASPLDPEWVHGLGLEMFLGRCAWCIAALGVVCLVKPNPWTLALVAAMALGIVVQRRYFSYHPVCLGPVLVLATADGLRELTRTAFLRHAGRRDPRSRAPRSGRVRAPGLPWAVCRARAWTSATSSERSGSDPGAGHPELRGARVRHHGRQSDVRERRHVSGSRGRRDRPGNIPRPGERRRVLQGGRQDRGDVRRDLPPRRRVPGVRGRRPGVRGLSTHARATATGRLS